MSEGTLDTGEWSRESERPARATRKPTRFRDSEFETQFRPEERRRRCNRLGRRDQTRSEISNVGNFNRHVKKADARFRLGRAVKKRLTQETKLTTGSRLTSPDQSGKATWRLSSRVCPRIENRPIKTKRKSLSKIGWPI